MDFSAFLITLTTEIIIPHFNYTELKNKYLTFRNITIGARLFIGFGIILLLIIVLGISALQQSNTLWNISDSIYSHSLQVMEATHDIGKNIDDVNALIEKIATNNNLTNKQIKESAHRLDTFKTEADRLFNVVYKQSSGNKNYIDSLHATYDHWKTLRDRIIEMRLQDKPSEAYSLFENENASLHHKLIAQTKLMSDFSNTKAENFYAYANRQKHEVVFWFRLVLLGLFIITAIISYLVFISIRRPLLALTQFTDQYSHGDYSIRSTYRSTNEIGRLSASFNNLAASVQEQMNLNQKADSIARAIIRENDPGNFCKQLLKTLTENTMAQVAAIHILNDEGSVFEPFEIAGLPYENFHAFAFGSETAEILFTPDHTKTIHLPESESGKKHVSKIIDLNILPGQVVTLPITDDHRPIALITMVKAEAFSSESLQLLDKIHFVVTARLLGVRAFQKISDISRELDAQNRELQEKTRELSLQSDELKEYNIELKLQKKEVEEANKYKSAFLSNMSHELRTPLNSIIALSGVLTRKLQNQLPEDEYKYLEIIERNGKQLLSLINDILDLSRIESGKENLNISKFAIRSLVDPIVETLEPMAAEKGIELVVSLPEQLPFIRSDSNKCRHILQNVIGNAVKFTENGWVKITVSHTDEDIMISVSDTGIGIEPEYLPVIFDEFRQTDDKTSRQYGGTGLGLAIAKKYIILLGGSIKVTSSPGEGSTFKITLPIENPAFGKDTLQNTDENGRFADDAKIEPNIQPDRKEADKIILLVEDSEPQLIQMSYILKKEGYVVQAARNGQEALDSIKDSIPDAMILDLMMPEVDGFQVIDSIRSQPETSHLPVIILTAKHITPNELFFLKGNNIHQIIYKGVVNRTELIGHVKSVFNTGFKKELRPAAQAVSNAKPRILVIENNHDNLETVKALLSGKYDINGTTQAAEGLSLAYTRLPDLMLLDISVSGTEGFEILDEIRKTDELKHIPVIALTARAMKGDKEELLAQGFDGYISKPIEIATMEQTIEEVLKKSNKE